jgi:hypothetical protein
MRCHVPRSGFVKELVQAIVAVLVDHPESASVSEIQGQHTHIVVVDVAKEDRGKVVGRRGATADAIRTILKAASGRDGKRYLLEIVED